MPRRYYSSTAVETTLTAQVSNSATTLPVASTSGFPGSTPYTLILDEGTVSEEIVTVTAVASLNLTVTRGADGTTAVSHSNGATVKHGVSARDFDEANSHVNDTTTDVHSQYVLKSLVNAKGDLITATADDTPARLAVGTNGFRLEAASGESTGLKWAADPVVLAVAVSDETTALTTGTAKITFRMPFAMTVTAVRASLSTASSSGNPTFDINEGGTSILGANKLSIDANEKTSTTAATATSISDSALADDAEITVDIDTAGTGAKGAKVYLIGTRA